MQQQLDLEQMVARAGAKRAENQLKRLKVIYEPAGRAREYAALAVNLYSGCGHGCRYCYAPAALQMSRERFEKPEPRARDFFEKLASDCKVLAGKKVEPVLMCFSCDAYQPIDCELKYARRAIDIFRRHGIAFQVLSKGGMRCARDFDLYKCGDKFAATLTFLDAAKSAYWEPHAAAPAERIAVLKCAKELGIETWVSLEPVIEPEESLRCIDACAEYVDEIKIGRWNHDSRADEINWRAFLYKALEKIGEYGINVYVKKDLAVYK